MYPYWRWTLYRDSLDRLEIRLGEENFVSPYQRSWSWSDFAVVSFRSAKREVYRNGSKVFAVRTSAVPQSIHYEPAPSGGTMVGDFEGELLELLVYDGTAAEDDVSTMTSYLRTKWKL